MRIEHLYQADGNLCKLEVQTTKKPLNFFRRAYFTQLRKKK
uniref:Uncharacterized protein n=1 Tax=Rhizophora mucronata TaxID=61149 RepID=A0A2P2QE44_RHIMU